MMEKPTHGLLTPAELAEAQETHDRAVARREIALRQTQALDVYYGTPEPGSLWPLLGLALLGLAVAIAVYLVG
jgi:hypothetical protein